MGGGCRPLLGRCAGERLAKCEGLVSLFEIVGVIGVVDDFGF